MSDSRSKGLPPAARTLPETGGSGKPDRKPKRKEPAIPPQLMKDLRELAERHRRLFKAEFLADPKLKDRAARFYGSLLLPKPKRRGRPPIESVTVAARLHKEYKRQYPELKAEEIWQMIYPQVIPHYRALENEQKKAQHPLLRNRMRSRNGQRRRRSQTPHAESSLS